MCRPRVRFARKEAEVARIDCKILLGRITTILQFRLNARLATALKTPKRILVFALKLVTSTGLKLEYSKYSHKS
jgi:hypothetical protein